MSTNTAFDLYKLYKTYFNNSPYYITPDGTVAPSSQFEVSYNSGLSDNPRPRGSIDYSSKTGLAFNKLGTYGQAIWFPVELWKSGKKIIEIEVCTVTVNLSKTIIRTPVSERQGTVKECFNVDDYRFGIKGFLIGKNRMVPEEQILQLKDWFETTEPIELHGAYPELFMNNESCRVAIGALDFPEVQGKATWIRPFNMTIETDFIQDLNIK